MTLAQLMILDKRLARVTQFRKTAGAQFTLGDKAHGDGLISLLKAFDELEQVVRALVAGQESTRRKP